VVPALTSSHTPAKPSASPNHTLPLGREPPGSNQDNRTIQSGSDATKSAARLEVIYPSAHVTPPLPQRNSNAPMTAAARQCDASGRSPARPEFPNPIFASV
jgi:hypothetical protein